MTAQERERERERESFQERLQPALESSLEHAVELSILMSSTQPEVRMPKLVAMKERIRTEILSVTQLLFVADR